MATSARNERELWDQARAAPRKWGSRKHKCQRRRSTSGKREHQSMTMACRLHAEMDDQGKSLVSTLWCVVCRQYETRICGPKNFSRAWTISSSDHKTSNITDHANSEPHDTAMMYLCTFTCYCIYCTLLLYNVSMKCVRSTFCNGRSSYSVVWQSSGCYEIVIFIPDL